MCRNIKRLRRADPVVTNDEIEEAARNLVRKLSGFAKPAPHNADVCDAAVAAITAHSKALLKNLHFPGGVDACVET
jgi:hypothetical protein